MVVVANKTMSNTCSFWWVEEVEVVVKKQPPKRWWWRQRVSTIGNEHTRLIFKGGDGGDVGAKSPPSKTSIRCSFSTVEDRGGDKGGWSLVIEGPVSGLEKDRNWTGPRPEKDRTAVLVFDI